MSLVSFCSNCELFISQVGILRAWNIILKLMDEVVDIRKDRIVLGSRICVHSDYGHQGVITKIMKVCV